MNSKFTDKVLGNTDKERLLSEIVIICSFGGIFVAFLLAYLGLISDPGEFYWGCIIASFVMAYLATVKPEMDIVSLITPLYAVIIFMGIDLKSTVLLLLLFSVTLVLLLVRLHARFSKRR